MNTSRWAVLRWTLIVLWWCSLPLLLYGAKQAWDGNRNRVEDWLPESFAETQTLYRFVEKFGTDELLMISWEGCTLDDPRIERYRKLLLAPAPSAGGEALLFRDVYTGPSVLEQLEGFPSRLDEATALERMRGWMLGPDGEQTGLLAIVSPAGAADRHAAVAHAFAVAGKVEGLSPETVHIAGTTLEGVAADEAGKSGLLEMNLASFAISIVLLVVCLRSVGMALLVFALAVANEQLSMALVHFTGARMDSVLLLMANVTYVVSISAGVHYSSYYIDAREARGAELAPWDALRESFLPSLVALGTTAVGFGSLVTSHVVPIQRFGLYAAICTMWALSTVPFMSVTLASMPFWGRTAGPSYSLWQRLRGSEQLTRLVVRFAKPILVLTALATLWGLWGLQYVRSSVQLHDLFDDRSRIVRDYAWLEERIGGLIPVEVVLAVPKGDGAPLLEQMRLVAALGEKLAALDDVDSVLSAATFGPVLPPAVGGGLSGTTQRNLIKRRLEEGKAKFVELRYLRETPQVFEWRLTARVPAGAQADYGALLERIRAQVSAAVASSPFPKATFEIGGGVPVVHKAQSLLISDLYEGFAGAFLLIAGALALAFRNVWAALVAMLPNVVPSILVFGAMGWMGWRIELGTMMTASAAMGIAVDDTLHCITWFREGLTRGMSNEAATEWAFRKSGESMIYTTLVCTFGLVVFAASPFMPIARFSWVMFTLLTTALFCDLLVTPGLLCLTGHLWSKVGRPDFPSPEESPQAPPPEGKAAEHAAAEKPASGSPVESGSAPPREDSVAPSTPPDDRSPPAAG